MSICNALTRFNEFLRTPECSVGNQCIQLQLQCYLRQIMRPRYWVRPFTLSHPYLLAILRISAILAMASLRRQACHQDVPRCHLTIPRTTTDPSVRWSSTGPKDGNCQGQRQLRPELVSGMARSVTTRKASIPIAKKVPAKVEIKSATNGKFSNLKWWTEVFSQWFNSRI